MGSFGTLNTAYTGLSTHARRLDVIGENIANASTPGYRRRRVDLSAIEGPNSIGVFSGTKRVGRGVEINSIDRVIDPLLEQHARTEAGRASELNVAAAALADLEERWNAFDNGGLNRALLDLGTAFDNLVNNPELTANRVLALQAGETVAAEVRQAAADGRDLAVSLGERATTLVNRANALSTGIAALDDRIRSANAAGADAASLEDERDRLIDELVSITNASVAYDENGGVRVAIDGYPLVAGNRTSALSAATVADPSLPAGLSRLVMTAADGRELRLTGGDLRGTQQAANVLIPEQLRALDTFATDLATAANAVHSVGEGADGGTGRNLFDAAAGALGFTVSADVAGSADRIAVAAAGVGGYDTTAAEQMASLIDAPDGPTTGWRNVVTNLAGLTAGTRIRADAAADAATSADQQRIAASGVSLDEEMTELIAAQRSYEASARVITTVDAMLDTLINRTGLVGR